MLTFVRVAFLVTRSAGEFRGQRTVEMGVVVVEEVVGVATCVIVMPIGGSAIAACGVQMIIGTLWLRWDILSSDQEKSDSMR